jgi:VanZ family protein
MTKEVNTKISSCLIYCKAYLLSILWALLIYFFSDQEQLPGFHVSILDFLFKKFAHMFVYAVLYYLLFNAYLSTHPAQRLTRKYFLIPLLIALIYAITDELHQSQIKGRFASTRDIAYDFLGMISILLHQQKML